MCIFRHFEMVPWPLANHVGVIQKGIRESHRAVEILLSLTCPLIFVPGRQAGACHILRVEEHMNMEATMAIKCYALQHVERPADLNDFPCPSIGAGNEQGDIDWNAGVRHYSGLSYCCQH